MFIRNGALAIISRINIKGKFFKSMKFRLIIVFLIIGIIPIYLFKTITFSNYIDTTVNNKIIELQNQCNILGRQLTEGSYMSVQTSEKLNAAITQVANFYNGRILVVDDNLKIIKDTYFLKEGKIIVSEKVVKCFKGENTTIYDDVNNYIELTIPITKTDTKEVIGVMVASMSTDNIVQEYEKMNEKAWTLFIALFVVVLIFAIFTTSFFVKPLNKLTGLFDRVSDGYFDGSISISGYSEIKQISEAFNQMLGRIRELDQSRQEFVSNVSHELKTPITSVKVLTDSLLMQEEAPVELYKEFLRDISEEIDRESKIINDLLSLVKLEKTTPDINISPVNINELLELILRRLRPIAAKSNIEVVLESFRPVVAEIDEVKLTLAISNLVENAIKYNKVDGWVKVSLNADHKYFYIKVADSGIGIPVESQELVFERFYRVDKTRSRETGGTGLGLAITRNIINMHLGAIKFYSKENEGTTFTVRIPLTYIP